MPEHDAESKVAIEGNGDPRELEMEGDGAEAPVLAPAVSAAPAAPVAAPAVPVSGLYVRDPQPANVLEELRIDVDGRYPQMVASGTVYRPLQARMHWAAELEQIGPNRWRGPIFFEHSPSVRFRWERVTVELTRGATPDQHKAKLTMHRPGRNPRVRKFAFSQQSMRSKPVSLELDWEEGVTPVLEVETCGHPDRPSGLPCETVSIERIYERAGFDVELSPGGPVPIQASGSKPTWSDFELHDAMEVYWSRFAPKAQWAVWAFYARPARRPAARASRRSAYPRGVPARDHVRRRPRPRRPRGAPGLRPVRHRDRRQHASAGHAQPPGVAQEGDVLHRRPRDRARLQPRALVRQVHLQPRLDPARGRVRGAQLHELPLPRARGPAGLLQALPLPLLEPGADLPAPRAPGLRQAGRPAVLLRPRPGRPGGGDRLDASPPRQPRKGGLRVHGAGGARVEAHEPGARPEAGRWPGARIRRQHGRVRAARPRAGAAGPPVLPALPPPAEDGHRARRVDVRAAPHVRRDRRLGGRRARHLHRAGCGPGRR